MSASIQQIVAENLKKFRNEAGLTQQALADKAEMSLSYYNHLERTRPGPNVTIEVLQRLADALGVSMGALLGEGNDREPAVQITVARTSLHKVKALVQTVLIALGEPPTPPKRGPLARGKRSPKRG